MPDAAPRGGLLIYFYTVLETSMKLKQHLQRSQKIFLLGIYADIVDW